MSFFSKKVPPKAPGTPGPTVTYQFATQAGADAWMTRLRMEGVSAVRLKMSDKSTNDFATLVAALAQQPAQGEGAAKACAKILDEWLAADPTPEGTSASPLITPRSGLILVP